MATRGTYQVEGRFLYQHHDNYPAGATFHFLNVLNSKEGLSLMGFLRCTEGMNMSLADNAYEGGGEYHYKIHPQEKGVIQILAYKIHDDCEGMSLFGTYTLAEFINKYLPQAYSEPEGEDKKDIEDNKILVIKPKYSDSIYYMSRKKAIEKADQLIKEATLMLLNHGGTGNSSSMFNKVGDIKKALNDTKFIENYNKFFAPLFWKAYRHEGEITDAFLM